jgi:hypothetical protein
MDPWDTLWSSKDENAYDLAVNSSGLYFATDGSGRIYEVSDNRKVRLIDQTDSDVMRLVKLGMAGTPRIVAATATQGKVLEIGTTPAPQGVYESPVHDAGSLARWGRLEWHGSGKLAFRTRSGNSARPDKTWSDWSAPMADPMRDEKSQCPVRAMESRTRLRRQYRLCESGLSSTE